LGHIGATSGVSTCESGQINQYRREILIVQSLLISEVAIIGPSDPQKKRALEPFLTWATPGQRGFEAMRSQTGVSGVGSPKKGQSSSAPAKQSTVESAKAAQLSSILESVTRLDDTTRRDSLLNSLCGEDVLELPLMQNPPSVASGHLKTDLLKHQARVFYSVLHSDI
jgi:SWI/SNF-related matrix-associated actin-dependent regulator of chromatin subfamily A3